jgi:hypothetical protein
MSGDGPHGDRRVKFTAASTDRLGKWAEHASDRDWELVSETLMRVVEGTWRGCVFLRSTLFLGVSVMRRG